MSQSGKHKLGCSVRRWFYFFITHPLTSLPNLMKEFDDFGRLSLIKINLQKCEALNILFREMESKSLNDKFPFKWTSVSIKYLSPSTLFALNVPLLFECSQADLDQWTIVALSWIRLCSKFPFLWEGKALFLPFIWTRKQARLRQTVPYPLSPCFQTENYSTASQNERFLEIHSKLKLYENPLFFM